MKQRADRVAMLGIGGVVVIAIWLLTQLNLDVQCPEFDKPSAKKSFMADTPPPEPRSRLDKIRDSFTRCPSRSETSREHSGNGSSGFAPPESKTLLDKIEDRYAK